MARFTYYNRFILSAILLSPAACGHRSGVYSGPLTLADHPWLKNIRIFIDPGHGGRGPYDRIRTGPHGVREETVNLEVSLILADMLKKAGAEVELSRSGDSAVSDDVRVSKAIGFRPHLLVSIHHAGSIRRADPVNYPAVLIWGSQDVEPASYDFATHLIGEMSRFSDKNGEITSDFMINSESGTTILRDTRHLCPGVIGEAGFYSDPRHSLRLKDSLYLMKEAEVYFIAISRYFRQGVPSAEVRFSCPIDNSGFLINMVQEYAPAITIRTYSGADVPGIAEKTLRISLDGVPAGYRKLGDDLYAVDYGKKIYPGFHRLRFHFRNRNMQSSMIMNAPFTVAVREGDYEDLLHDARTLLRQRRNVREALKMFLSALSMGSTDPDNRSIMRDIALCCKITGDHGCAEYYMKKFNFTSTRRTREELIVKNITTGGGYRLPIESWGKTVRVSEDDCCKKSEMKREKPEGFIKQFFSRQF